MSEEFDYVYTVHSHYDVVVIMRLYMYVTCNMLGAWLRRLCVLTMLDKLYSNAYIYFTIFGLLLW